MPEKVTEKYTTLSSPGTQKRVSEKQSNSAIIEVTGAVRRKSETTVLQGVVQKISPGAGKNLCPPLNANGSDVFSGRSVRTRNEFFRTGVGFRTDFRNIKTVFPRRENNDVGQPRAFRNRRVARRCVYKYLFRRITLARLSLSLYIYTSV